MVHQPGQPKRSKGMACCIPFYTKRRIAGSETVNYSTTVMEDVEIMRSEVKQKSSVVLTRNWEDNDGIINVSPQDDSHAPGIVELFIKDFNEINKGDAKSKDYTLECSSEQFTLTSSPREEFITLEFKERPLGFSVTKKLKVTRVTAGVQARGIEDGYKLISMSGKEVMSIQDVMDVLEHSSFPMSVTFMKLSGDDHCVNFIAEEKKDDVADLFQGEPSEFSFSSEYVSEKHGEGYFPEPGHAGRLFCGEEDHSLILDDKEAGENVVAMPATLIE